MMIPQELDERMAHYYWCYMLLIFDTYSTGEVVELASERANSIAHDKAKLYQLDYLEAHASFISWQ